jgi:hypothetical protein
VYQNGYGQFTETYQSVTFIISRATVFSSQTTQLPWDPNPDTWDPGPPPQPYRPWVGRIPPKGLPPALSKLLEAFRKTPEQLEIERQTRRLSRVAARELTVRAAPRAFQLPRRTAEPGTLVHRQRCAHRAPRRAPVARQS